MTIGTSYFAQTPRSCSSRSLLLWTIWLIANGAAGRSGWARSHAASASVISASHSSSCSAGRALSAGIEPTTPDVHCATTSFGLLTMKSGAPMTGSGTRRRTAGSGMAMTASERFERERRHAGRSFDDRVALRRRAAEDVLGVEPRRLHLGSEERRIAVAGGEQPFGGEQGTRHLPARHDVAGEHQVR